MQYAERGLAYGASLAPRFVAMKRSLSGTFVFSFIITIALMMTLVAGSYWIVATQTTRQAENNADNILADTAGNLRNLVMDLDSNGSALNHYPQVYQFMSGSAERRLALRDNLRALLTSYVNFRSGAVNAYLCTRDGAHLAAAPEYEKNMEADAFLISRGIFLVYDLSTPFRAAFFTHSYQRNGRRYIAAVTPVFPDTAAPLPTDYAGALVRLFTTDMLTVALPNHAGTDIFVADGDTLLVSSAPNGEEKWAQYDHSRLISQSIPGTQWAAYVAVSEQGVTEAMALFRGFCFFIGVTSLLVLATLMLVQYRSIVGPIIDIAAQTDAIADESGSLVSPRHSKAEFAQLTSCINGMLHRLRQLGAEMLRVRVRSYEEQITFLQAQINPHFLYNNFECIRGMAAEGNDAAVREMASCMAAIYRYCCKGMHFVPLSEEYECMRQYVRIITLRYEGQYQVELTAGEDALLTQVPRMILQPLVENAIQHGFLAAGRRAGRVLITAKLGGGELLLTVQDDGAGMDAKRIAHYNAPGEVQDDGSHSHIGIINVMRRLELLYEATGVMQFRTSAMGGLCIRMRLPLEPENRTILAEEPPSIPSAAEV